MMTPLADYRFVASYDGDTGSLNVARIALAAWLANVGGTSFVDDAQLVVSELASNAIEAAPGDPYDVEANIHDETLEITVRNRGRGGVPEPGAWMPASMLADRGRGLFIVQKLADQVIVDEADGSVSITACLKK